jgi:nucleotide-binding universal stress UspA family protein
MNETLTGSLVVPVADEDDARKTAAALERYEPGEITVVYVVEKGKGVPDKTPVKQSESIADDAFAAFRNEFPEADTKQVYRRDIVAGIFEAASEVGADAIVFRPRGGSRLVQLLAGDRTLRLVTEADRPVVTLPEGDAG